MRRDKPFQPAPSAGRRRGSIRLRTVLVVLMTLILVLCAGATALFSYCYLESVIFWL